MGGVIQLVVPLAVPDPPVELDHVTLATPTLSLALPLTTIELELVTTLVLGGDRMVNDGGVVSGPLDGGVGDGGVVGGLPLGGLGCWRLTVTV